MTYNVLCIFVLTWYPNAFMLKESSGKKSDLHLEDPYQQPDKLAILILWEVIP